MNQAEPHFVCTWLYTSNSDPVRQHGWPFHIVILLVVVRHIPSNWTAPSYSHDQFNSLALGCRWVWTRQWRCQEDDLIWSFASERIVGRDYSLILIGFDTGSDSDKFRDLLFDIQNQYDSCTGCRNSQSSHIFISPLILPIVLPVSPLT
jgi:hypothetical protein